VQNRILVGFVALPPRPLVAIPEVVVELSQRSLHAVLSELWLHLATSP
jgi:hypothetical protein